MSLATNGRTVVPLLLCLATTVGLPFARGQNIAVNQLGYLPGEHKAAKVNADLGRFLVRRADGLVVHEGPLVKSPYDEPAAEHVWTADFSALDEPGTYRVEFSGGHSSPTFRIGAGVYDSLHAMATRGLYVSRCGHAVRDEYVPHGVCHRDAHTKAERIEGGRRVADGREAYGGWHNGGDYRRSTLSAFQAVNRILLAAELQPGKFDAAPSLLAPHEGVGDLPDALVEAKWGLDWMMRMQDAEGGVLVGIGPFGEDEHPGRVGPEQDDVDYYLGEVFGTNTAKAGVAFARASRVLRAYDPAYADGCLARARRAYDYMVARDHLARVSSGNTVHAYLFENTRWQDVMYLAAELYRATGEERYHDRFRSDFHDRSRLSYAFPDESMHTHTMRMENVHEALLSYCLTEEHPVDDEIVREIRHAATLKLQPLLDRNLADGYGNVLPYGAYEHRHTIGNMLHKGWTLLMYHEAFGGDEYREVALEQLHVLLGRNALGRVFVTGLGSRPVTDPHYRPTGMPGSAVPPGLPVKGPSHDAEYLRINYTEPNRRVPPRAKAYIDDYWKHWVNEPDIEVSGYLIAYGHYFGGGAVRAEEAGPDGADVLTVRARGTAGTERLEVTLDGQRVGGTRRLSTGWVNYEFDLPTDGVLRVGLVDGTPDAGGADRNLRVDYVQVEGNGRAITLQAEDQPINTGSVDPVTRACEGDASEFVYCTGYIEFGRVGTPAPTPIVVHAAGRSGREKMHLKIDGEYVRTWTSIGGDFERGSFANYVHDHAGPMPKRIEVRFPDEGGRGHDLRVDAVEVGGVRYEAEHADAYSDGGGACNRDGTERLWCRGGFVFDLTALASRSEQPLDDAPRATAVTLLPNPTSTTFRIVGDDLAAVTLYDVRGQVVRPEADLVSGQEVDVSGLGSGVYLVMVRHTSGSLQSRRLVVR